MGQKKKADQAEEGKGRGGKKATARIQKKKPGNKGNNISRRGRRREESQSR